MAQVENLVLLGAEEGQVLNLRHAGEMKNPAGSVLPAGSLSLGFLRAV
jgi:hypothetical protein